MNELRFTLAISAQDYLAYYTGAASNVVAQCRDGRTLQLPASALRRFLMHDGIHGEFAVRFDENNKLLNIVRLR